MANAKSKCRAAGRLYCVGEEVGGLREELEEGCSGEKGDCTGEEEGGKGGGGQQAIARKSIQRGDRTYRTTNFLGRTERTGSRAKQMTKQATAARLQTAKIISRSQRLTGEHRTFVSLMVSHRTVERRPRCCSHGKQRHDTRAHMPRCKGERGCHARCVRRRAGTKARRPGDSQANQPSSSSLLLGAGRGAPGPSVVGSWTYPRL
jgi:hypothetical protein